MSATANRKKSGMCLCGAVKFRAHVPDSAIQLCHCQQCQRWTGGGPLSVVRVKDVEISGQDMIQSYHASAHGERAFCKVCGTNLYWKMQDHSVAFLPVGLFDDQDDMAVREEIFVDRRPEWLPAHQGANQQDEAAMQAQLRDYLESHDS